MLSLFWLSIAVASGRAGPRQVQELPVVEVRSGGAGAPEPHPVYLQIFASGRLRLQDRETKVPPTKVRALLRQLETKGAFRLSQSALDTEFASGAEPYAGERGGGGIITLIFPTHKPVLTVWMNRPEQHRQASAKAIRTFTDAYFLVLQFAIDADKAAHKDIAR